MAALCLIRCTYGTWFGEIFDDSFKWVDKMSGFYEIYIVTYLTVNMYLRLLLIFNFFSNVVTES